MKNRSHFLIFFMTSCLCSQRQDLVTQLFNPHPKPFFKTLNNKIQDTHCSLSHTGPD